MLIFLFLLVCIHTNLNMTIVKMKVPESHASQASTGDFRATDLSYRFPDV